MNSRAHATDLHTIYILWLLVTQLVNEDVRTETQVCLALKPTLSTPTLHSYLTTATGRAVPTSTAKTTNSTTIYDKEHHLRGACCADIRKLWLGDVKVTQILN